MPGSEAEADLFGAVLPPEPTQEEALQLEAAAPEPTLQPGQHVERALAAELEPEEPDEAPEHVVVADSVGQAALFDLDALTKDPLAEVRAQWNSVEATTPEARLEVFRSVTVKSMKLAYKLGEYERVIAQFTRVCKALKVRNPSEAVPLLLEFFEERTNRAT